MKDKIIFVCFAESTLCAVTECSLGRHRVPPTTILQTFTELRGKRN